MGAAKTTPRSILASEMKGLKPLLWLFVVSVGLLAASVLLLDLWKPAAPRPPKPVQIHADERLSPEQIHFKQSDMAPESAPADFRPMLVYEVTLEEGAAFSHPYVLNFLAGSPRDASADEGALTVAELTAEGWREVEAKQSEHPAIVRFVEVDHPGIFALGRFVISGGETARPKHELPRRASLSLQVEGRAVPLSGAWIETDRTGLKVGEDATIALGGELPESLDREALRLLWFDSPQEAESGLERAMGESYRFVATAPGAVRVVFVARTVEGAEVLRAELELSVGESP